MARIVYVTLLTLGTSLDCIGKTCPKEHLLLQKKILRKFDSQRHCGKEFEILGRNRRRRPMTECQGNCDSDDDCAVGLKCFQRLWREPVPGCSGRAYPIVDYCYNPECEGLPPLDSSYGSQGASEMPMCSGDCDSDDDCAEGLSCFQRDDVEPVPGCAGAGVAGWDYCYRLRLQESTSRPSIESECLCVFDIDRTLTGKQGTAGEECPHNIEVHGIWDSAYTPGWLTISDAGQNLENTFCSQCYLGIVSAGWASNSDEKNYLLEEILSKSTPFAELRAHEPEAGRWSRRRTLGSPLVLGWRDTKKQDAVDGIVAWYEQRGIHIDASQVTFFGDRTENIGPFMSKGYNAREISCSSRDESIHDGMVGYCGATASEIVETSGIQLCERTWQRTCLCVFDIDRTLTGKQGVVGPYSACPANKKIRGVWDAAYSRGWLTLSEAGQNLQRTFCNDCYLGVVSAGTASGRASAERKYLLKHVLKSRPFNELRAKQSSASYWSTHNVRSPLVLGWPDKHKQEAVTGIVEWYRRKGIAIASESVYFFGDRTENIGPFRGTGFNSREISCARRDYTIGNGIVGLCGAELHEIRRSSGVNKCR